MSGRGAARGHDARIGVVRLPIDVRTGTGREVTWGDDAPLGVLGFVHPGKDPGLAVDAAAQVGRDVVLLGQVVAGHEDYVADLVAAAAARGVGLHVTGHLTEEEMDAWVARVAVPLAPYRHISASGSIGRWIACGRRPVALGTPWVRELATVAPWSVSVVETVVETESETGAGAAFADVVRAALADPGSTLTDGRSDGLLSTAQAAQRQASFLAAAGAPA